MRTNIEIDDQLMDRALQLSKIRTKREVVNQALKLYVKKLQRLRLLDLKGQVEWIGDLAEMREL